MQAEPLARRARGRARVVHGRQRLVEVRAQRVHRAVALAAPRRSCTTRASTPHERLALLERERVNVLCMAPTEYRVIAKRATLRALPDLRGMVAAGEALNPEVLRAWQEATGLEIRDGYGQTETGQMTGAPLDEPARPGSMGRPLPGVGLEIVDGELTADPATRADVLPRLPRRARAPRARRLLERRGPPRRTVRGTPATGSPRTTTAGCTSRAATTT